MSAGAFCPICHHLLTTSQWNQQDFTACPNCQAPTRTLVFPAMARTVATPRPEPRTETEAGCFFHTGSRAENVCNVCGRFLCSLCTLAFGSQKLCPDCIYKKRRESPLFRDQAILFDNIAISILALSVLTLSYLFLGLVISLLALCLVFIGWRYQRTLVRRSRFRFAIALILGLVGSGAWVLLLLFVIQSLPRYA